MQTADNKTVSIIIPAYNAEKFIKETVASAMASTYPHIEVIIVNDGSTDNTAQILNQLQQQFPQIRIFNQINSGVAVARNLAVSMATGKYILPLDADDLITTDYIEKAVAILSANADVKVVYSKAEFFGDKVGYWNLPEFKLKLLARKNLIFVSGLYRKADYEKTDGYRPEIKGPEDWDFWISMLKNGGKVVRIPDICFYYRIHPESKRIATRSKKKEGIDLLNERHKAFMYKSLGGKLHYVRQLSIVFNFFTQLIYSLKVVTHPGFVSFEDLMYNLPEKIQEKLKDATDKKNIEFDVENIRLRVEVFQSFGFYKLLKSKHNATKRYKIASASEFSNQGFSALGYIEQYSYFFRYIGYYVEMKSK